MIQTVCKCDVCGSTVEYDCIFCARFSNYDVPGECTSFDICDSCLRSLRQRVREKMGMNGPLYEGAKSSTPRLKPGA